MSDDANGEAVERVARQFIERNGADALQMLRELAAAAEDIHDAISAKAWRDHQSRRPTLVHSPQNRYAGSRESVSLSLLFWVGAQLKTTHVKSVLASLPGDPLPIRVPLP